MSDVEIKLSELAGFRGLRWVHALLRTETAGVVALSVLQAHWGDLTKLMLITNASIINEGREIDGDLLNQGRPHRKNRRAHLGHG